MKHIHQRPLSAPWLYHRWPLGVTIPTSFLCHVIITAYYFLIFHKLWNNGAISGENKRSIRDHIKITMVHYWFFLFFFITSAGKHSTIKQACYKVTAIWRALTCLLRVIVYTFISWPPHQARLLIQAYLRPGCSRQRPQAATLRTCSSPTCLPATCCERNRCDLLLLYILFLFARWDSCVCFFPDGWGNNET